MKTYKVVLKETLFDTILVEANNEREAEEKALDADDPNVDEILDRNAECVGEASEEDEMYYDLYD